MNMATQPVPSWQLTQDGVGSSKHVKNVTIFFLAGWLRSYSTHPTQAKGKDLDN